jgi:hypothetical protein
MNRYISGQLRLITFLACAAFYVSVINGSVQQTETSASVAGSAPITLAMK